MFFLLTILLHFYGYSIFDLSHIGQIKRVEHKNCMKKNMYTFQLSLSSNNVTCCNNNFSCLYDQPSLLANIFFCFLNKYSSLIYYPKCEYK